MKEEKLTYTKAVEELESILKKLENPDEINIDLISEQLKRASVLMDFCRSQLNQLDTEITKLLQNIN